MFSGAQVSLYPMSGNFAGIILEAIKGLDPYRDTLRIETDDISTLMVGPPDVLFAAMRDYFAPGAPDLCFFGATYTQLNHYEPARHSRELLQDPHEDGHLVTLVTSDAPGRRGDAVRD